MVGAAGRFFGGIVGLPAAWRLRGSRGFGRPWDWKLLLMGLLATAELGRPASINRQRKACDWLKYL